MIPHQHPPVYIDDPFSFLYVGTYEVPTANRSVRVLCSLRIIELVQVMNESQAIAIVKKYVSLVNASVQCVVQLHMLSISS
jgi:hypothetical protein